MSRIVPAAVTGIALATIGVVVWALMLVPGTILNDESSAALGPTPGSGVATVSIKDGDVSSACLSHSWESRTSSLPVTTSSIRARSP